MSPLQHIALRETHTVIQAHLLKLCILHLPFIHVTGGYIVVNYLKNATPHYLSYNTQLYP